jgi:hypothetical protein
MCFAESVKVRSRSSAAAPRPDLQVTRLVAVNAPRGNAGRQRWLLLVQGSLRNNCPDPYEQVVLTVTVLDQRNGKPASTQIMRFARLEAGQTVNFQLPDKIYCPPVLQVASLKGVRITPPPAPEEPAKQ